MKRFSILIILTLVPILVFSACGKIETTTPPPTSASATASPAKSNIPLLPVTTSGAAGISISGATLNGSFNGQAAEERGFDWGIISGKYEFSWAESGIFQPGSFSRGITGLTEGTTYYFRCKAHNSAGWGYGGEQSFKTLATAKITAVMLNTAKQGENIIVTITGSAFTGAAAVSFGEGIAVNEFNVISETQISADVTIAEKAAGGTRTVSITTPAGTSALADCFTVERVLRTVIWTNEDFDWLSHFLTGDVKYEYHIHLQEGNKMAVTSLQNFNFSIEVRDGKLCYNNVPASAWDNVYYTSYPHLRYDTANKRMITDSLPQEVLQKLFDPPEDTMPMIETLTTGDGTITITYYSP